MKSIEIRGLQSRLTKLFAKLGQEAVKTRASQLMPMLHSLLRDWKSELRAILSKPASSRGFDSKGRLNPHNSVSYNGGFPMMISGKLRDSLQYRVIKREVKTGVVITILQKYRPVYNSKGSDYGEIINVKHRILSGWKNRATNLLEKRIDYLVRNKGFK